MSDEFFISAFKKIFHNKDASTHEEIVCEQAFLLEKCIGYSDDNPILGLFKLGELMNDEKYGRVLREKYNYTPKKYYEETCKKILWVKKDNEWKQELEKQKEDLKNKEEHIQKLLEIKELQQNHIIKVEQELEVFRQKLHAMEESRSWKMTQPIRKLKEKVRK